MSELSLEDLAMMIRTITNDDTIIVIRDDKEESSYYDSKDHRIVLSISNIPKSLRESLTLVDFLFMGLAVHEAGHPLMDATYTDLRVRTIEKSLNPKAMKIASNIIDDAAVNFRMLARWETLVGRHLAFLLETMGDAMMTDTRNRIQDPTLAHADLERGEHPRGVVVAPDGSVTPNAITLLLYLTNFQIPISDAKDLLELLDDTQRRLVGEGIRIIHAGRTAIMWDSKAKLYKQLYEVLIKLANTQSEQQRPEGQGQCSEGGGSGGQAGEQTGSGQDGDDQIGEHVEKSVPVMVGGTMGVDGDEESASRAKEKAGDDAEDDDGEQSVLSFGESIGADPSASIPTPPPNLPEYLRLVRKNQARIKSILDRLKDTIPTKVEMQSFRKRGRMMPNMITIAGMSSRPPENIYHRLHREDDKMPTRWSIIIDLSGSMDLETVKDVMVTLCEVASRYLKEDEFAIYLFGSGLMKVKSMYEDFENIRARLGGISGLGATYMSPSIEAVRKELLSLGNHYRNKVLIVSDFWLDDETISLETLEKLLEQDSVDLILLDFLHGDIPRQMAREYGATKITGIEELPDRFIEHYLNTKR